MRSDVVMAMFIFFSSFSLSLRTIDSSTPSSIVPHSKLVMLSQRCAALAPNLHRSRHGFALSLRGGFTESTNESQVDGHVLESLNSTVHGVNSFAVTNTQPTLQKNRTVEIMQEGLARFLFEKGVVFYNNVQVVNRDLSVLMLRYLCELKQSEMDAAASAAALAAVAKNAAARQLNESTNASLSPETNGTAASCIDAGPSLPKMSDADTVAASADPAATAAAAVSRIALSPANEAGPPVGSVPQPPGRNRTAAGLRVLDALSATGLRALRYTLEVRTPLRPGPRPPASVQPVDGRLRRGGSGRGSGRGDDFQDVGGERTWSADERRHRVGVGGVGGAGVGAVQGFPA
jgi:hypothetical protein